MEFKNFRFVTLLVVIIVIDNVVGDLVVSSITKCGSKICKQQDYCSQYEKTCKPCFDICDKKTHNFDEHLCNQDCQDYLHDIRYVRKDQAGNDADLQAEVRRLRTIATASLTLTILLIIVLLILSAVIIWRWKARNHVTVASFCRKFCSKKSNADVNEVPRNGSSGKPDLRIDIPSPETGSEMSPVTLTTTISRRPAEDNTLDYAYDNPAMSNRSSPQHPNNNY